MSTDPTGTMVGWLNVRYAESPDTPPELQSLDLIASKSVLERIEARAAAIARGEPAAAPERLPLVVFIHGGSLSAGNKTNFLVQKAPRFTGAGFMLVSINYRLANEFAPRMWTHPAQIEDAASALGWLHRNGARFGGDPDRIVVMGHSAGAHLAALVATDPRWLRGAGVPPDALDGVVLLDSASYDLEMRATESPDSARANERVFGSDKAVWADASPITHVKPGAAYPPFLVYYTDHREVGVVVTKKFHEALRAAGASAELVHAEGQTHLGIHRQLGMDGDPVTDRVLDFIGTVTGAKVADPSAR